MKQTCTTLLLVLLGAALFAQERPADDSFNRLAAAANAARDAARVSEAINLYRKAVALKPDWMEGWWYLGTLAYSSDRAGDGRDAFRRVTGAMPNYGPAWAFLGLCEFELKNYDAALTALDRARQFGVGDDERLFNIARLHLGMLLTRSGFFEDGFEVLQGFGRDRIDEPAAVAALGLSQLLLPLLPSEIPADKEELVMAAGRAAWHYAGRRTDQADEAYKALTAKYPNAPGVHYAFGLFLVNTDPEKALGQFRREIEITPAHVFARLQMANEYLRRGEPENALPIAEKAEQLDPDSFGARLMYGRALADAGKTAAAIEQLSAGAKLRPSNAQIHFQLAKAYRRAGNREQAAAEEALFRKLETEQKAKKWGKQAVAGPEEPGDRAKSN